MKSVLGVFLFFTAVITTSCSKQAAIPEEQQNAAQLFFKDANIAVANMKAVQNTQSSIQVSFSTLYENNIQKIELMSGCTSTTLCSIYVTGINGNSSKSKVYSFDDTHLKGKTMYYMIRYTTTNGDWGYTPLYIVTVN